MRASALPRLAMCPSSEHLPQVRQESPDAQAGNAVHAFLAAALTSGRENALSIVPDEYRERCEAIDFDRMPIKIGQVETELPVQWNGIHGTADVVGVAENAVVIVDWKGPWAEVTPAASNLQTGLYAVAAAAMYRKPRAYVAIIRVREDGSTWQDWAHLDEAAMAAMAVRITTIAAKVEDAFFDQRYEIGAHCRYCPGRAACPAHLSLAASIGRADPVPFGAIEMTPETMMMAHRRIKIAEKIIDDAKAAIRAYVEHFGAIEHDGRRLMLVEEQRDSIAGDVAYGVLSTVYGSDVAKAACSVETSKAAIERAIKPLVAKVAPAMREIVADIANAGGVKTATIKKLVEKAQ